VAGATIGGAAIPGGVAVAAASLGADKVAEYGGKASLFVGGVGAGALAYKWGANAYNDFKKGEQLKGVGWSVLSLNAGVGSTWAIGTATGIKPLAKVGEYIGDYAIKPIWEKAVVPAGRIPSSAASSSPVPWAAAPTGTSRTRRTRHSNDYSHQGRPPNPGRPALILVGPLASRNSNRSKGNPRMIRDLIHFEGDLQGGLERLQCRPSERADVVGEHALGQAHQLIAVNR
jgi:hypothetical protein